ncbi:hypothetical protein L7F22_041171 [Adiantum nelumboides]|nr:hypothetical protein [Adiantum nelumboides]
MADAMYSGFLSKRRSLFLIGGKFRREGGTVLVEYSDVGDNWGAVDVMVSGEKTGQMEKWLELAASFCGTVYLVDLKLSEEGAVIWWKALRARAGKTFPNSLFLLFDLTVRRSSAVMLMHTLRRTRIKNLAVYSSNLHFNGDTPKSNTRSAILLNTLHLEQVSIECSFLSALSRRQGFDVSHTLSLINIPSGIKFPVSDTWEIEAKEREMIESLQPLNYLEWQLTHLSLVGFYGRLELISFMKILEQCTNVSLQSLSLNGSIQSPDLRNPALIGAVVDALHKSGLQFLNLGGLEEDPIIQAQLLRNRGPQALRQQQYKTEPAKAVRLFICGDAYAGKTTLLSTMGSHPGVLDRLKAILRCQRFRTVTLERTLGIEIRTISRDDIHLSVWDMAGQTEFHAFHDHMIPDPSASHGSPAMFMFVWSPVDSKNEGLGKSKNQQDFESSFGYWLKFITSKTRQSNILRKLIVVLTRKDQTKLVRDALEDSIRAFSTTFSNSIQVVEVLEVDARREASVKPLVSCIFQIAHEVLKDVRVYSICSQVSEFLSRRHNRKSLVGEQPIISWNNFTELCTKQFNVDDPEVHKAIAYSLNESGNIIYLSNLPFLVLEPNWFCHEVMGSLIHFPESATSKAIIPINGYVKQDYLEKVLKESSDSTVEGSLLLALMEAMHICCKVPGDAHGIVFIPATLSDPNTVRDLQWRGAIGERSSTQEYAYVGRRLECDKKDLTFLTPGLFPTMQVAFNKAFGETKDDMKLGKADVKMGKGFMSICLLQESEIIVQWGLAKGENVIDVMIRAPDDEDVGYTLVYVEAKIIKTVIGVCAQPVGNQGVRLVEGVIRPDCLHIPSPLHVRADQCALILDLKQELKEQLEEGRRYEKLRHLWGGNDHLQPIISHFTDLLGPQEFMKVLMSYKASLETASLMSATFTTAMMKHNLDFQTASTSGLASQKVGGKALMQNDIVDDASTASQGKLIVKKHGAETQLASHEWMIEEGSAHVNPDENEQVVDALSKSMVKEIYRKMLSMDGKLEGLKLSVDSMHGEIGAKLDSMYKSVVDLRNHALPRVQNLVEQSLNFAIEKEAGRIPRFVFLTTDDGPGVRRRMVSALVKGLKHVRIELFCEHREGPHRVDGQKGLYVATIGDEGMITRALPYVNRFLKVLTLAAKVGAHVFAGAGSTIPDLSQLVALAFDTPGFLDLLGSLSNISTTSSPEDDLTGWQQWLVSVLEKNGGMKESNITSKFLLRRALYKDTSKVAWLCDMHYKDQCPLPLV